MDKKKRNIPTVFVIFGATGDLVEKKIFPSLFHLYCKGRLPQMIQIIGFARRDISDTDFQKFVSSSLHKHADISKRKEKIDSFLKHFSYSQGNFDTSTDYKRLAGRLGHIDGEWKVCSNKLFYLAAPPNFYESIFTHLSSSGLTEPCSPEEGWTRVIVEKPFGKDLATAKKLDFMLGSLFREEQIYRIDHYLGKEMVQNILAFRFGNTLFEDIWNNKYVEKVEVRIMESFGLSGRGDFFDGVGALRDVGQNHLLQMMALAMMDTPNSLSPAHVRQQRSLILSQLHKLSVGEVKKNTFRAQYNGYQNLKGVNRNSKTETYFKVISTVDSPRWAGVPVVFESGKEMNEDKKEIVVTFKPSTPFFKDGAGKNIFQTQVRFALDPENKISVNFWAKKPGLEFVMQEKSLDFTYGEGDLAEEYERLLLDVIDGNQLLFVSTEEVEHMWSFTDPIVTSWEKNVVPLINYKKKDTEFLDETPHTYSYTSPSKSLTHRQIGIIGLGRMGGGIARRLVEYGWDVVAYNRSPEVTREFELFGGSGAYSFDELFSKLRRPAVVLVSLPHTVLDEVLLEKGGILSQMRKGDILIEAGNSFYKDTIRRSAKFEKKGVGFVDVGVSGGPGGARYGASLMIGGNRDDYDYLKPLFRDMSVNRGEEFFEGVGAGHFVKMVHNGIEYGMMQALAEGFDILAHSSYKLDLKRVASVYNHGSVIESKLVGWLKEAFDIYGVRLDKISGSVGHSGEGQWTIETATKMKIAATVIEKSLEYRKKTEDNPTYAGKILSALRNRFGGHSVSAKNK